jgi:hypothetical protein
MIIAQAACSPRSRRTSTRHGARARPHRHHAAARRTRRSAAARCRITSASTTRRALARRNIDAWWPHLDRDCEAVVVTASGCGVMVRDYGHLLAHDPAYARRRSASRSSRATRSRSSRAEWKRIAPQVAMDLGAVKVAFHAPCTLQHGMRIKGMVEDILQALGYTLDAGADPHLCCGSAGTYSILQPELAAAARQQAGGARGRASEGHRHGEHRLPHASRGGTRRRAPLDRAPRRAPAGGPAPGHERPKRSAAAARRCTAAHNADARAPRLAHSWPTTPLCAIRRALRRGGRRRSRRADLFLAHRSRVRVARVDPDGTVGACVRVLTHLDSRGSLVAKLDDVTIREGWQGAASARRARGAGPTAGARVDAHRHRVPSRQRGAWRFYERLGFVALTRSGSRLL